MHTNVSIRGLAGDEQGRTLVLFDGIPINTSDEGSVNWNSIHIDNVQRIEVFKGPGSSLYGNSAMGGVINIISKRPVSPFSLNASGSYGSLNTWKTDLGLSSRINDKFAIFYPVITTKATASTTSRIASAQNPTIVSPAL